MPTYALSQVVIPLFLTAALFLGPVVMASINDVRIKLIMMPHYWAQSMRVSRNIHQSLQKVSHFLVI